ncbi:MAG: hypothetical protein ACPL2D_01800 [Ignavibacteria bacterium]
MKYRKIRLCFKIAIFASLFISNLCICGELPYTLENHPFLFFNSKTHSSRIFTSLLFDELDQGYAIIVSDNLHKVVYSAENELLRKIQTENGEFYFINGFFPNYVCKSNVIPLIYDELFIKLIQILKNINFTGSITDIFRTEKQQASYYKQRWTDKVVSPHTIGLAVDLNNLTLVRETQLKSLAGAFGISFLKHGRKYNRHIHLQDNFAWGRVKENNISVICKRIFQNFAEPPISYKSIPHDIVKESESNFSEINLKFETPSILTIDIFRVDGVKSATIKSGIFEPGFHQLQICHDFLPAGIYLGRLFVNGMFYDEIVIKAL